MFKFPNACSKISEHKTHRNDRAEGITCMANHSMIHPKKKKNKNLTCGGTVGGERDRASNGESPKNGRRIGKRL